MVVNEMFYHSWPSSPRLNSFLLTFFVSCSLFATIFLQVIHGRINLSINCNYNFFDIPLKSSCKRHFMGKILSIRAVSLDPY